MPASWREWCEPNETMLEFQAEAADTKRRLDQFLHERMPEVSRARIQQWIEEGHVLVQDAATKASHKLRGGERILVEPMPPPPLHAEPEAIPLRVLYEDDDVVAVDKPAGMVVHAGAGVRSGTLVNALLHRYQGGGGLSTGSTEERPGIVHRLDRFTSGVILVARNDHAHQSLAAQFAGRTVEKIYLALVHGKLERDKGVIQKPIARDPGNRARMTARLKEGRHAVTHWKVLRRLGSYTFLELRIGTGRTHQIRVHLASIGHPVVGDRLYGAHAEPPGLPAPKRYFLHAQRITFLHPCTGEAVTVEAPLTGDITEWMELAADRI